MHCSQQVDSWRCNTGNLWEQLPLSKAWIRFSAERTLIIHHWLYLAATLVLDRIQSYASPGKRTRNQPLHFEIDCALRWIWNTKAKKPAFIQISSDPGEASAFYLSPVKSASSFSHPQPCWSSESTAKLKNSETLPTKPILSEQPLQDYQSCWFCWLSWFSLEAT